MTLPLLISVPHAGLKVPVEVKDDNLLTPEQIIKDGDEGAQAIYAIGNEVEAFVTTDIARAYLDMNRSHDDHRSDGVVKTETIYQEQIYKQPLSEKIINQLLKNYYFPYHKNLSRLSQNVILGIDCHTMVAVAPPINDDAGTVRPYICLSDADGTCPNEWTQLMASCLETSFGFPVSINNPFQGGFIIRHHASELPWLQLELSRAEFISIDDKRKKVLKSFRLFCEESKRLNDKN